MTTTRSLALSERPVGLGPDGRPQCRWCRGSVPKPRRTFCSAPCVEEFLVRSNPAHARRRVWERDAGVCARCGFDCEPLHRIALLAERAWEADGHSLGPLNEAAKHAAAEWRQNRTPARRWEADHIVAVVEGGGQCGLENLRTLCRPCHVEVTAELAGRRARARRTSPNQLTLNGGP